MVVIIYRTLVCAYHAYVMKACSEVTLQLSVVTIRSLCCGATRRTVRSYMVKICRVLE